MAGKWIQKKYYYIFEIMIDKPCQSYTLCIKSYIFLRWLKDFKKYRVQQKYAFAYFFLQ